MIGAVPNGVDRHAESHIHCLSASFKQFFGIHIQNTAIFRLIQVGLEHSRRTRAQSTIHKSLDRANAQPIVAEAGAQAKMDGMIQVIERDAFRNAQFQPAVRMKLLKSHETGTTVEIMDTSEAHAQ